MGINLQICFMGKKVIRLTESEFKDIVHNSVKSALCEIDGKTLARVPNAATTAMDNIQNGIFNKTIKSTFRNKTISNDDEIIRADGMLPKAFQSFLVPYKDFQFMYFAYRREGNPVHLLFKADSIKKNMDGISILGGEVIFGKEKLPGDIQIQLSKDGEDNLSYRVFYKYKGNGYKFVLEPDIRTSNKWNELVQQLGISQLNMNKRGI